MDRSAKLFVILMLYGCIPLLAVFSLSAAWKNIIAALISCIVCVISARLLPKPEAADKNKTQVAVLMAALAVIAVALYLLSGIYFGSMRVVLLLSLVLTGAIPTAVIIISSELARRSLLSRKSRIISALSFAVFVAADVLIVPPADLVGAPVRVIVSAVLSAVSANILYHYLSEKYGSLPNILYRIIMSCYPYFLPIRPRFPAALLAIVRILLPIVILYFIRWTYREKTQQGQRARRRRSILKYLIDVVCLLLCVSFVMLVAGVGHYKLLVIGSDSMSGVMDKGDAVIYRKYTDQKIELGDIVLFERDGAVIVHRVIDIESVNGTERYHTKGDANDAADVGYLTADRVIGISVMRLKYIGYPAVWARSVGG